MRNGYLLLIIMLYIPKLFTQIYENLEYTQTIDRCVKYEATLLEHNSKLYVDAKGGIEEYLILNDGSLELISYISTYHYSIANAVILGESLFVATEMNNNYKIFIINISNSPMELVDMLNTNVLYGISKLAGNEQYFMYNPSSSMYSMVYNRNTMEYLCQLLTGGYYAINGNYLFYQSTINDSTYVNISDIQNVNNIIQISSLNIGINQQNIGYFFYDDVLFITQNEQVAIINISDINNPTLIATIDNIPNVPSVNFFTSLLIYNNYLMFGNTETKFWIYDISDITSPQLVSVDTQFIDGSSYKNSLLFREDYIYYSRIDRKICQINVNELPNLSIVNEFGNNGQFQFFHFTYPFILYSNPYQKTQYYINIVDNNPEPQVLAESPNSWVSPISHNDSIICFITSQTATEELIICSYNENTLEVSNDIPLGTTNYDHVFFRADRLILTGNDPGEVSINEVSETFSLNEVGYLIVGEDAYIVDQTSSCSDLYLFIKSEYNDEKIIQIFENQPPFTAVGSFSLSLLNNDYNSIYRLTDNRILFIKYNYPGTSVKLCDYTFPDQIEVLDSYISNGFMILQDDLLVWHQDFDGSVKYFTWENDEIELLGSNDFGVEIYDNFFVPDESKLFAVGRYNVQEYSCDYVSVNDHQIPVLVTNLSNYPNPFNPETTISFNLSESGQATLEIYNIKGQKVKILIDAYLSKGEFSTTWNGRDSNNKHVSSGEYIAKLKVVGDNVIVQKMILLK